METNPDPQTRADPTPGLSQYIDPLSDYLMPDAFNSQPEVDIDPLDDPCGAHHMLVSDERSAWDSITGNEVSRSARYWESIQSPQSVPSRQGSEVCPSPTSLPSGLNPTSQLDDHVAMLIVNSVMNNSSHIHAACEHEVPLPPICDHTNCYPPSDVGYLSRRFEENMSWIRGRALAVSTLAYRRRGIYSLPVEILQMIPNNFPVFNPFTDLGGRRDCLQTWNRHRAFAVLAATCMHLRAVFYNESWTTRVVTPRGLPAMVTLLKEVSVRVHANSIETLITQLSDGHAGLLRDCLLALPSLHTLGIADDANSKTKDIKAVFKNKPDFPNIRRAAIPLCAHPILSRLPNVEELACYYNPSKQAAVNSILTSWRGPYVKERNREVEPVLKSLAIIGSPWEYGFIDNLVEKFPRLRKLCLSHPSREDMTSLRGLKEIVEIEILLNRERRSPVPYNLEMIKSMAIEILQASECHKDCKCQQKCGCATTSDCRECTPPKRFLRVKESSSDARRTPQRIIVDEESCLQEIQVSPRRVVSTK